MPSVTLQVKNAHSSKLQIFSSRLVARDSSCVSSSTMGKRDFRIRVKSWRSSMDCAQASDFDDEVEPSLAGAFAGHAHLKVGAVETVAAVAGFVSEIELRGQDPLSRGLHLDVDMPGAPRVFRRNDGLQAIVPLSVGELVAAIAKAAVVVLAVLVRVPEIEQGVGHGPASGGQDLSRHDQPRGLGLRLHQGTSARRVRLEKGPFGLL